MNIYTKPLLRSLYDLYELINDSHLVSTEFDGLKCKLFWLVDIHSKRCVELRQMLHL